MHNVKQNQAWESPATMMSSQNISTTTYGGLITLNSKNLPSYTCLANAIEKMHATLKQDLNLFESTTKQNMRFDFLIKKMVV